MGAVTFEQVKLESLQCVSCGMTFAVPGDWLDNKRAKAGSFHCPNGHDLSYRETAEDRLKKDIARQQERVAAAERDRDWQKSQREVAEKSCVALRGQVTKAKKRVGNGVCPCCNRSFTALRRHMQTKHPDYKEGATCA